MTSQKQPHSSSHRRRVQGHSPGNIGAIIRIVRSASPPASLSSPCQNTSNSSSSETFSLDQKPFGDRGFYIYCTKPRKSWAPHLFSYMNSDSKILWMLTSKKLSFPTLWKQALTSIPVSDSYNVLHRNHGSVEHFEKNWNQRGLAAPEYFRNRIASGFVSGLWMWLAPGMRNYPSTSQVEKIWRKSIWVTLAVMIYPKVLLEICTPKAPGCFWKVCISKLWWLQNSRDLCIIATLPVLEFISKIIWILSVPMVTLWIVQLSL